MLTKPFKPLALAFLVNLIISVEDKIKYNNPIQTGEGGGGAGRLTPPQN